MDSLMQVQKDGSFQFKIPIRESQLIDFLCNFKGSTLSSPPPEAPMGVSGGFLYPIRMVMFPSDLALVTRDGYAWNDKDSRSVTTRTSITYGEFEGTLYRHKSKNIEYKSFRRTVMMAYSKDFRLLNEVYFLIYQHTDSGVSIRCRPTIRLNKDEKEVIRSSMQNGKSSNEESQLVSRPEYTQDVHEMRKTPKASDNPTLVKILEMSRSEENNIAAEGEIFYDDIVKEKELIDLYINYNGKILDAPPVRAPMGRKGTFVFPIALKTFPFIRTIITKDGYIWNGKNCHTQSMTKEFLTMNFSGHLYVNRAKCAKEESFRRLILLAYNPNTHEVFRNFYLVVYFHQIAGVVVHQKTSRRLNAEEKRTLGVERRRESPVYQPPPAQTIVIPDSLVSQRRLTSEERFVLGSSITRESPAYQASPRQTNLIPDGFVSQRRLTSEDKFVLGSSISRESPVYQPPPAQTNVIPDGFMSQLLNDRFVSLTSLIRSGVAFDPAKQESIGRSRTQALLIDTLTDSSSISQQLQINAISAVVNINAIQQESKCCEFERAWTSVPSDISSDERGDTIPNLYNYHPRSENVNMELQQIVTVDDNEFNISEIIKQVLSYVSFNDKKGWTNIVIECTLKIFGDDQIPHKEIYLSRRSNKPTAVFVAMEKVLADACSVPQNERGMFTAIFENEVPKILDQYRRNSGKRFSKKDSLEEPQMKIIKTEFD